MSEIKNTCCFTGYRANKLPFSIENSDEMCHRVIDRLIIEIKGLADMGVDTFISGGAYGFDIMAAMAVIEVIRQGYDIKLKMAIPYEGQSDRYLPFWKLRYDYCRRNAAKIEIVSDHYYDGVFLERNRVMVNQSRYVIAFYDGKRGGTRYTYEYALKNNRFVINLADYED